jgi:hypothetical protein
MFAIPVRTATAGMALGALIVTAQNVMFEVKLWILGQACHLFVVPCVLA